jgi:tetratricopeptide (TPR) repeat protein
MEGRAMEILGEPAKSAVRWKVRLRSRILVLVLLAIVYLGWKAAPGIESITRIRLAERAIAAGRLEEAQEWLELQIAAEPLRTRPRLLKVEVARKMGRITEAEEALQRAVELGLPVEEGRRQFTLLLAGQDFARAERSLRQVLEDHPDDVEVKQALAEGYARLGR